MAGLFLLIGLIPLLGLLNWFTTLPIAILGIIISSIAISRSRGGIGIAGLVISLIVLLVALLRLYIGGGVV